MPPVTRLEEPHAVAGIAPGDGGALPPELVRLIEALAEADAARDYAAAFGTPDHDRR